MPVPVAGREYSHSTRSLLQASNSGRASDRRRDCANAAGANVGARSHLNKAWPSPVLGQRRRFTEERSEVIPAMSSKTADDRQGDIHFLGSRWPPDVGGDEIDAAKGLFPLTRLAARETARWRGRTAMERRAPSRLTKGRSSAFARLDLREDWSSHIQAVRKNHHPLSEHAGRTSPKLFFYFAIRTKMFRLFVKLNTAFFSAIIAFGRGRRKNKEPRHGRNCATEIQVEGR